jgi:hypothetical protein
MFGNPKENIQVYPIDVNNQAPKKKSESTRATYVNETPNETKKCSIFDYLVCYWLCCYSPQNSQEITGGNTEYNDYNCCDCDYDN